MVSRSRLTGFMNLLAAKGLKSLWEARRAPPACNGFTGFIKLTLSLRVRFATRTHGPVDIKISTAALPRELNREAA